MAALEAKLGKTYTELCGTKRSNVFKTVPAALLDPWEVVRRAWVDGRKASDVNDDGVLYAVDGYDSDAG
eukprot:1932896-Prymnesium_polylepis.1